MGTYRKKPVKVEAFKFYVDAMPDWFTDAVSTNQIILRNCNYNRYTIEEAYCEIKTLEGVMIGRGGDYIIKGIKGEIYPCKSDIFKETYEEATQEAEKYVKWKHVHELLMLIKHRDAFMDWSASYERNNQKVKNTIEWLKRNAKEF